ncbi:MAG TPA: peptide-methionine (S)-S-oxide reductase [Gemmatimonadaceae bacterium]
MRSAQTLLTLLSLSAAACAGAPAQAAPPRAASHSGKLATAVLAGGCYWTMETVFEHVRGVVDVVSGMSDAEWLPATSAGRRPSPPLRVESVRITYDPAVVTYADLLHIFFTVAHDPTQVDRQGPDVGVRYRSAVLYTDTTQFREATDYIGRLEREGTFRAAIATRVVALRDFAPVPAEQQDFAVRHPDDPYIVTWDRPKLAHFREVMPEWYVERGSEGAPAR